MKSLFLITFGPAGSGKGYIINELSDYLNKLDNIRLPLNYEYARIDDYIETDVTYIEKTISETINKILPNISLVQEIKRLRNFNACLQQINNYAETGQISDSLQRIEQLSDDYTQIYMDTRKKYDQINDDNLNLWIRKREHIIFETTGTNKFDWIFQYTPLSDPEIFNDYMIIIIYPYVETNLILARALHRFVLRVNDIIDIGKLTSHTTNNDEKFKYYVKQIQNKNPIAVQNGNNIIKHLVEVPRLPKLIEGKYSIYESIINIQNNIAHYLNECVSSKIANKIHSILLYDNIEKNPILAIDLTCGPDIKFTGNCNNIHLFQKKYASHLNKNLIHAIDNINSVCSKISLNDQYGGLYGRTYLKYRYG